jgi:hypothetical protein
MEWNEVVDRVTPYIVKIETPMGHGTGFLCFYNDNKTFFGIATALHVVSYAHEWQQPIRLHHYPSSTTMFIKASERLIFVDRDTDSAVILAHPGKLKLPDDSLALLPSSASLAIGSEVGWLGFPALAPSTLCFFQGSISARQEHAYLIDGVAINGVSGGPVFFWTDVVGVQIIGTVSAYFPNRAAGDALPGLSIARDVSHFHDTIKRIQSLDEAIAKQQKQEEEQAQKTQPLASPVRVPDKIIRPSS